jgi:hypothetical protein
MFNSAKPLFPGMLPLIGVSLIFFHLVIFLSTVNNKTLPPMTGFLPILDQPSATNAGSVLEYNFGEIEIGLGIWVLCCM